MWGRHADKLARRDDLCVLPERRKVPAIAGDQKIGTSRIGALNKDIIVRVARHLDAAGGGNQMAVILDELKTAHLRIHRESAAKRTDVPLVIARRSMVR
jgi:hypothetical protein